MERIQTVSRYLLVTFNLLIFILPLAILVQTVFVEAPWLHFFQKPISTPEGCVYLNNIPWTFLSKILWGLALTINFLPLFLSFFVLKGIFKNYLIGEIFTPCNARHFRKLGTLFFGYGLLAEPLSHLLQILAVTLSNPPGHRYLSIGFGTPNLEALFCGVLLVVISWIMLEGNKLREEQELVV